MTSSEEHNFENNWRKAFGNTSETPPKSVWERIENRLDEEDERVAVIPLWQQWQTLKWIAAASVTILLVSLGGWWLTNSGTSNTQLANKENVKNEKSLSSTHTPAKPSNQEENDNIVTSKTKTIRTQDTNETIAKVTLPQNTDVGATHSISQKNNSENKTRLSKINRQKTSFILSKEESFVANTQKNTSKLTQLDLSKAASELTQVASLSNDNSSTFSNPITTATPIIALNSLASKEMHALVGLPKRQPWVAYQAAESEKSAQKTPTKEYWASVAAMPASYNAGVAIGGSQGDMAFATSSQGALSNTPQSAASTNRPLFSYALEWKGGVQLAQRWSLETGLHYLQGNSLFEGTNGFNVYSNSYVNNLEAAIHLGDNTNQRFDFASISTDKSQIQSLTTPQNIHNSYQFLQVPVQAGYALLKPKRKLSLWLLTGFVNNIFLRNRFESGQERTLTVSGNDGPYRKLSFSASMGVRIQYKMNKRWTTLLSGNYQRALGSNTRSEAAFQARPQLFGVGAGLRYGF